MDAGVRGAPVGEAPLDSAFLEEEAGRVLEGAAAGSVMLRLFGGLASRRHSPGFSHLQDRWGRVFADLDFAGYGRDGEGVRRLLASLGYREDPDVYMASGGSRIVADHPSAPLHVDVFFDRLDFCHTIPLEDRLERDSPTVPLAEMVLSKMQIVEINEKDLTDTIVLLLEHPLGSSDTETINAAHVAGLCGNDWGLWRTVTMNLDKVAQLAAASDLSPAERARIDEQVGEARQRLHDEPKTLRWKLRARVGDRVKWYQDVEELDPS